jgi:hypothetical protein
MRPQEYEESIEGTVGKPPTKKKLRTRVESGVLTLLAPELAAKPRRDDFDFLFLDSYPS